MKQSELADRLLTLQEKIDEAHNAHASCKGALRQIKEQLQQDFGIKTFKEANRLLKKCKQELEEMDRQLKEGVKKLEKACDF